MRDMSQRYTQKPRREFLRQPGAGTALFVVPGMFADAPTPTPRQTEGPFYPDHLPPDTDNDLILVNDGLTPAVGEVTHLSGRVSDTASNAIEPRTHLMTMKTKDLKTMVPVLLICLSAGCSDPSKDVHRTTGSDPQQVAGSASAAGTEYVIRAGSTIGFVGSKVTGSHTGGFTNFAGAIRVADGKVVGNSEIQIAMGSTWSDSDRLTGHLKSPDFFDVEKHPLATFTVTGVEGSGNPQTVTGNLNLHGVTRSISFPAKVQVAADAVTVAAEFAINRKDFNINYPGRPDDLIRDNVVIKLDIRATPGPARPEDLLPRS